MDKQIKTGKLMQEACKKLSIAFKKITIGLNKLEDNRRFTHVSKFHK